MRFFHVIAGFCALAAGPVLAEGPAFDCSKAESSAEEAVMAAAAIRSTQARATMLLGTYDKSVLSDAVAAEGKLGHLFKVDLEGRAELLAEGQSMYFDAHILPGQSWALVAYRDAADGATGYGVELVSLERKEGARWEAGTNTAAQALTRVFMAVAP